MTCMLRRSRAIHFAIASLVLSVLVGCHTGYMKTEDLTSNKTGPKDCDARCHELGMEMGALVLIADTLPACVCQPVPAASRGAQPGAESGPASLAPVSGAAPAGGYVAIAAAAEAASRQAMLQQQAYQRSSQPVVYAHPAH
jgi:hypothetical protein